MGPLLGMRCVPCSQGRADGCGVCCARQTLLLHMTPCTLLAVLLEDQQQLACIICACICLLSCRAFSCPLAVDVGCMGEID
jgi:hypothetical protein